MFYLRSTFAAVLLGLSAVAAPALANSDSAIDQSPVLASKVSQARIDADDILTTGSIGVPSQISSAKGGNAEQTNFAVPQYGQTSGGHAH